MSELKLLLLDFETYYDDDYSLRKMSPAEYILDQRYETIMCAVREGIGGKTFVVDGPEFGAYISQFDPRLTVTVTFNSLFDNGILAWHYGFVPRRMIDAMTMARALRGHILTEGASLAAIAKTLGLPPKGTFIANVKGKRRADIIAEGMWPQFCTYAAGDVDIMAGIVSQLIHEFPESEQRIQDLVLRCGVIPKFDVDTQLLEDHLNHTRAQKTLLLQAAGITNPAELQSAKKFEQALRDRGVEIKYKTSLAGKTVPAFAKTDGFMEELLNHEDAGVQTLAAARLGVKSTLEETRTEKLLRIARLPWQHYRDGNPRLYQGVFGGSMPIPLRYAGAHTHRLSGDWGMNMQNLPRESVDPYTKAKEKSKLRRALIAPPGYAVIAADLAQIEARLVAWIAGELSLLMQFANKQDPYANLATDIFGFKVDRKVHKVEGFIGKTGILGLGYGCGVDKFYDMVVKLARLLNVDLGPVGWSHSLAEKTVGTYRTKFSNISASWKHLDFLLRTAWVGTSGPAAFGPGASGARGGSVIIARERVVGPTGLSLLYRHIPSHKVQLADGTPGDPNDLYYQYGKDVHKIYGAKMLENIIQFLARLIVMHAALRLNDRGFRFVLQAHDELVFIEPIEGIDETKQIIYTEMTRRPSWAPDLPLDAEVKHGRSYGEAK